MEPLLVRGWPPQLVVLLTPLLVVVALIAQMSLGFRVIGVMGRKTGRRLAHAYGAFAVAGALAVHGLAPLTGLTRLNEAFRPAVYPAGLVLLAMLAVQILLGFHVIPTGEHFLAVHITLAFVIVTFGLAHGVWVGTGAAHPREGLCGSCHRTPASHFSGGCERCHTSPGVAWYYDSHPRLTGPHVYWQFACVRCHPNGYAESECTCHSPSRQQ